MSEAKNQKQWRSNWLEVESELILHTTNALNFFWGHVKNSCSFHSFNLQILAIKDACYADDPFADWILLKVYDVIVQTYRKLHSVEEQLQELLKPEEGLTFKLATHKGPIKLWIRFNNSYTRAAIHCLASYDRIMRSFLASQASCIKPNPAIDEHLQSTANLLRQLLITPKQWQKTDVKRHDLHNETEAGKTALVLFADWGQLPEPVLSGKLRAPKKIIL